MGDSFLTDNTCHNRAIEHQLQELVGALLLGLFHDQAVGTPGHDVDVALELWVNTILHVVEVQALNKSPDRFVHVCHDLFDALTGVVHQHRNTRAGTQCSLSLCVTRHETRDRRVLISETGEEAVDRNQLVGDQRRREERNGLLRVTIRVACKLMYLPREHLRDVFPLRQSVYVNRYLRARRNAHVVRYGSSCGVTLPLRITAQARYAVAPEHAGDFFVRGLIVRYSTHGIGVHLRLDNPPTDYPDFTLVVLVLIRNELRVHTPLYEGLTLHIPPEL